MFRSRFLSLVSTPSRLFVWGQPRPSSDAATPGPGPKVSISLLAQSIPTLLQCSRVEVPYAKEIIPQRSNGRVEVKVSTWSEMNLTGN